MHKNGSQMVRQFANKTPTNVPEVGAQIGAQIGGKIVIYLYLICVLNGTRYEFYLCSICVIYGMAWDGAGVGVENIIIYIYYTILYYGSPIQTYYSYCP